MNNTVSASYSISSLTLIFLVYRLKYSIKDGYTSRVPHRTMQNWYIAPGARERPEGPPQMVHMLLITLEHECSSLIMMQLSFKILCTVIIIKT